MKKLVIICAAMAVAALSLTACHKEESTTNNQKFIASFEQAGNGKATIDADLQMYWNEYIVNNLVGIFAPGFRFERNSTIYEYTPYYAASISDDGKTAVLEHYPHRTIPPFPADQQGPFYAATDVLLWADCHINADGSLHIGKIQPNGAILENIMPMVARADNYGELKFKHVYGLLKVYVNLPQEYTADKVYINPIPFIFNGCDVYWDANGEISLSNIEMFNVSGFQSICKGNGFFFAPLCPGNWENLKFRVKAFDNNQQERTFLKTMNTNASIHIERAGITTLTINLTENDIQN